MKSAYKKFLTLGAISATLFLVGCKSVINGTLNVTTAFTAIQEKTGGDCGGDRSPWDPPCSDAGRTTVTIQPGQYQAKINFLSKTKFEIEVKSNQTKKFQVKVPSNVSIPSNGEFQIPANKSGQNFDLAGAVKTVQEKSRPQREWESCRVVRDDMICGPQGCVPVRREYWGRRDVEYRIVKTDQSVVVNILAKNSNDSLAQFKGREVSQYREYTHQGFCF